MKKLYRALGGDERAVCAAYIKAESDGRIFRKTSDLSVSPYSYARGLLNDGKTRGWLAEQVADLISIECEKPPKRTESGEIRHPVF